MTSATIIDFALRVVIAGYNAAADPISHAVSGVTVWFYSQSMLLALRQVNQAFDS
jgi:hypothetical protein